MLSLIHTPSYRKFKHTVGQTNHYLITILIGLEGVSKGKVEKEDDFNVVWNPKDLNNSIQRSRRFARSAGLSWSVDGMDGYLGYLNKKYFNFASASLATDLEKLSVYKKYSSTIRNLSNSEDLQFDLTHLAIQWRNNLIHYHAENPVDEDSWRRLKAASKKKLGKEYGGLDLNETLTRFKKQETPTFKDVASMVSAIRKSVESIDLYTVNYFDGLLFAQDSIRGDEKFCLKMRQTPKLKQKKKMEVFLKSIGFVERQEGVESKIKASDMPELINLALDQATTAKKGGST